MCRISFPPVDRMRVTKSFTRHLISYMSYMSRVGSVKIPNTLKILDNGRRVTAPIGCHLATEAAIHESETFLEMLSRPQTRTSHKPELSLHPQTEPERLPHAALM